MGEGLDVLTVGCENWFFWGIEWCFWSRLIGSGLALLDRKWTLSSELLREECNPGSVLRHDEQMVESMTDGKILHSHVNLLQ